jgi:hypothetical protein
MPDTYLAFNFTTYEVEVNGRTGTRLQYPQELVSIATRTQLRRFCQAIGGPLDELTNGSLREMAEGIFNSVISKHKSQTGETTMAAKKVKKKKKEAPAKKAEKKEAPKRVHTHEFVRPKELEKQLEKLPKSSSQYFAAILHGRKVGDKFTLTKEEIIELFKKHKCVCKGDMWSNFAIAKSYARKNKCGFC